MIEIRRIFSHTEDIFHEFGPAPAQPLRRGYIAAVLTNPYAGRYEPDILPMMDKLNEVGVMLAHRLLGKLGVEREGIQSYGKGAIVGADGEIEHGALWHVPGGYAMRELLGWSEDAAAGRKGNALAIVPSTKKVAGPGATLDVPLTNINASYVRSHFDAIEARVPGAPRQGEMVVILAMSTGARVHARVGGLKASEISKWDGLR
jgi:Amino acid synthesis